MLWALLGLHVLTIGAIVASDGRLGRGVFALAAIPAAVTTAWAIPRLGDDEPVTAHVVWVEGLDLTFSLSVGPLAALMTVIVSGIGVAVFAYAAGYFGPDSPHLTRFAATLLGFSTAMVGLVWSDSVWTLFVFWEATSVTSFLLVGHKDADPAAGIAARRALLITAAGGLVLLAGFLVLAEATGTPLLSEMGPVTGTRAGLAAVLVLVAAATKSAQVPFHVWLPGAMAAPTPVSAYLHSATMVKAGVLLVALADPVLRSTDVWKPVGLAFGLVSIVWGAVGALRHTDAKLILAWGTISQLGLMISLLVLGSGKATFAAISILTAHAVFKAALFMVVGEIDVRTGTRDIRELGGLASSMPIAAAVAVVSGASMAGVPPLLGFPAKEAAVEAVLGLGGTEQLVVGLGVIGGSVLTVAYTTRLLLGLFGSTAEQVVVAPRRWAMTVPASVLGLASVLGFVLLDGVNRVVVPAAEQVSANAALYELIRWPGATTAFWVSTAIVGAGLVVGVVAHGRVRPAPRPVGADAVDGMVTSLLRGARSLTSRTQHGSLPIYLLTMAGTAAAATTPFLTSIDLDVLYRWDSVSQAVLAAFVVALAVGAAGMGSRLGAALGLGAVGLAVAGLFVAHGAPDLALTQLLVETVIVVGFVVGLGHLTRRFPPTGQLWRSVRLAVAGLAGLGVMVALVASASNPTGAPPTAELVTTAVDEGGGNNVVNVILTDVRALDTLGEVVVLVVVAVGILALANVGRTPTPPSTEPVDVLEETA